jgi:hypothetical protein
VAAGVEALVRASVQVPALEQLQGHSWPEWLLGLLLAFRQVLEMWPAVASQQVRLWAPRQVAMPLVPGLSTSCILRISILLKAMWLPEKAYYGS